MHLKIPSPLAGPHDRPVLPGDDDIDILAGVNLKMFEAVPPTVGPFGSCVLYWDVEGPWGFHVELNQEVVTKGGLKVVQPTAPVIYRLTAHTRDESRVLGEIQVNVNFDGCHSVFQGALRFAFNIALTEYVHDSPELKFQTKTTYDPVQDRYFTEEIPPVISFADNKISASLRVTTTALEAIRWNRIAHSVILRNDWTNRKFVFSGGDRIIFVVHDDGRFVFHRHGTAGSEFVSPPYPIANVMWSDYKFVFSGGNGIIYAVDGNGQLLFYRVTIQGSSGVLTGPAVIGYEWQNFKSVFSTGNGNIFAITNEGNLLHYRDSAQNGTGEVAYPNTVRRVWQYFRFAFSAGQDDIYAATGENLYLYEDVISSNKPESRMSSAKWKDFDFVFSGMNRDIYGVDKSGNLHYFPESTIHLLDLGLLGDGIAWILPDFNVGVEFSFRLTVRDGGIYTADEQVRIAVDLPWYVDINPIIVAGASGTINSYVQRAKKEILDAIKDIGSGLNDRFEPPTIKHRRRWVRILEQDDGTVECLMCPLPEDEPVIE